MSGKKNVHVATFFGATYDLENQLKKVSWFKVQKKIKIREKSSKLLQCVISKFNKKISVIQPAKL